MDKVCRLCKQIKAISEFSKQPRMKDGHFNDCKKCCNKRKSENRMARLEHYRKVGRDLAASLPHAQKAHEYRQTQAGKESNKKAVIKYKKQNPERAKAIEKLNTAVARGKLKKLPCWICGDLEVDGHHPAYDQPLNVVWLCRKHHKELHTSAKEFH